MATSCLRVILASISAHVNDLIMARILLYKDKRLSVCLLTLFLAAPSSVVSPRIGTRFTRYKAFIFRDHGVCFKKVVIAVVRHLRHFKCQGVDDFLATFL